MSNTFYATLASMLVALASADAMAATVERASMANAVARCQGALPSYEGAIRKRPLAVQNEGASSAFVTCAFIADQRNTYVDSFVVYARSANGAESTLSCTAVVGFETGSVQYSTKSVSLPANGVRDAIYWTLNDFPETSGIDPNLPIAVSCSLPPGAGLNDTYLNYSEDVGS